MNLKPASLGAEPKKLVILGVLVAVAAYFLISSHTDEGPGPVPSARNSVNAVVPSETRPPSRAQARSGRGGGQNLREFRPSLKPKDFDRSAVDPTLRLDLLAKLKSVQVEDSARSLFKFNDAPEVAKVKEPEPIKPKYMFVGPPAPPSQKEAEAKAAAAIPPAPPIPLKFYGFIHAERAPGPRRAFFLDGEDIIVAAEGDVIKKRYKIVRIGVNSAVVEDTQFEKASNKQQTLPLVEEQAG